MRKKINVSKARMNVGRVPRYEEARRRLFSLIEEARRRNRTVRIPVVMREVAEAVRAVRARPSR